MKRRQFFEAVAAITLVASGIVVALGTAGSAATTPSVAERGDPPPATAKSPGTSPVEANSATSSALNFNLVWDHTLDDAGAPIAQSSPVVATLDDDGEAVVVGDRSGHLYAYHLSDGSSVEGWPVSDGGTPIDSTPSATALNGSDLDSVFVGTGNAQHPNMGGYYAYGPTGHQLWDTIGEKDAGEQASLTVGDLQGSTAVFAGTLGHLGFALDAATGSLLSGWPLYTADTIFSTAAVADLYGSGQDDLVVGGASTQGTAFGVPYQNGGHVRVINAQGQLIYDYNTNQEVDSSPAVGQFLPDGATGIAVGTGSYYAGASDTGDVLAFTNRLVPVWSQTLDGCTGSSPALVNINGQQDVVEGTDEGPTNCGGKSAGSVYLLNGQNGDVIWDEPVTGRVIGSVVAADLSGDGQPDLLVPTTHGVEVLDDTGQEVTVLAPDLGFQNSPLVTDDANGTVGITVAGYDGNNEGVIRHYEIPGSDGALAVGAGSWPMFHHDPSLSGTAAAMPDLGTLTPTDLVSESGDGQVTLSWTAPTAAAASGYNVYVGTSPGQWGSPADGQWTPVNGATPITSTSYVVGNLSNREKYYFIVTALDAAGEGSPSSEVSAVPRDSQSALSIVSRSGTYGKPLPLKIRGGSDAGVVTYVVDNRGTAGCSISARTLHATATGTCTIQATMAGNSDYEPVSSSSTAISIRRAPTRTILKTSSRVVDFGHERTEILTVIVSSKARTPTGIVRISGTKCRITLDHAKGTCRLSSKALGAGTHRLMARFGGSKDLTGSRSTPVKLVVDKR